MKTALKGRTAGATEDARRLRLLRVICVVVGGTPVVQLPLQLSVDQALSPIAQITLVAGPILILLGWLAKRPGALRPISWVVLTTLVTIACSLPYWNGGLEAGVRAFYPVIALVAVMLLGRVAAITATAVLAGNELVLFLLTFVDHAQFPVVTPMAQRWPLHAATWTMALVIVCLLGIEYERLRRAARAAQDQAAAELRATNVALAQAHEEALVASHAKSAFLANMSHELRTPLNGILGLSQVLGQMELTADQRDCVDKIVTSGRSLLDTVNDALDFSKVEAGRLELERLPFSLVDCVTNAVAIASASAALKRLTLRVDLAPDVPTGLVGDRVRLQQVLVNLVANAVKFTDAGSVVLAVTALGQVAGGVRLRFVVSDTGIGIAPSDLGRLFSPFTQADVSTTRRFGGTGLGLAICRRLVTLMGGTIGVESVEGQGSAFWFTADFALGDGPAAPTRALPTAAGAGPNILDALAILVVDDNRINQEVARRLISRAGAAVTVVDDGPSALTALRDGRFDLVLMDVQMPIMSGYEATRQIREDLGLRLPVLALTAGAMHSDEAQARAAGMDDFVPKPLDPTHLIATVAKHCGRALANEAPMTPPATPSAAPGASAPPLLDIAVITRAIGDDPELLASILVTFKEEFGDAGVVIDGYLEHGQTADAERRLHTLRGAAGALGAGQIAALAGRLEARLRQNPPGPIDDAERAALIDLMAKTIAEVDTVMASLPTAG